MLSKNEILLKLSDYQNSVKKVVNQIESLSIHIEINEENFFNTQVPFDIFFENKIKEILDLFTQLNDIKKEHYKLIDQARFRPAKIKTGNVKNQITQHVDTIEKLEENLKEKLQEVLDIYMQNRYLIFARSEYPVRIQNIIGTLEKTLMFFKEHTDRKNFIKKLADIVSDGKLAQSFCRQNGLQLQVIDSLSQEIVHLKEDNASLTQQLQKALGEKEKSTQDEGKGLTFFTKLS
ncbi:hypothetical protein OQJ18_06925 [Fluoribacter dumoffii]|uniref:hypothetical protein n=1 Tax=Fluoribacter dumoffii TaxID=463 RepID=UPI0022444D5B|nr:hypothetical protein [Fluoribacter dumoffii]MCW8418175.1 hypothetical protein [Fluoribacter dumoffii]MCW8453983.1 hypothetical protein [Fluoribacter dumoffii]MCW8461946.1 hypothetical protein [Fluoribacter dumoffii]MCW8482158.1 hypothetical protein [Fluoribacter dumoffii]